MDPAVRRINENLRPVLAVLRRQLADLYGPRLRRVILFGSQARGDARPDSDVDVLVVLDGPVQVGEEIRRTSHIVAGLSLEHNLVITCVFMNDDEFEHGHEPLRFAVQEEGVDL